MKRIALILLLAASPALSQDNDGQDDSSPGGIEGMLRDLFSEVEPRLRELRDAIGDLDNYEAPERLPNGDIIIRRKTPLETDPEGAEPEQAEPGEPVEPEADGPIEL